MIAEVSTNADPLAAKAKSNLSSSSVQFLSLFGRLERMTPEPVCFLSRRVCCFSLPSSFCHQHNCKPDHRKEESLRARHSPGSRSAPLNRLTVRRSLSFIRSLYLIYQNCLDDLRHLVAPTCLALFRSLANRSQSITRRTVSVLSMSIDAICLTQLPIQS